MTWQREKDKGMRQEHEGEDIKEPTTTEHYGS